MEYSMRGWVHLFFEYAIKKRRAFYWQWDQFMIIMRKRGRSHILYEGVIEIPSEEPPYLHKSSFSIGYEDVIPVLMRIYDLYPSRMENIRNIQSSTRFLSFKSFLHLIMTSHEKMVISQETIHIWKTSYIPIQGFLAVHDIIPEKMIRQKKKYTSDQLIDSIQ